MEMAPGDDERAYVVDVTRSPPPPAKQTIPITTTDTTHHHHHHHVRPYLNAPRSMSRVCMYQSRLMTTP